METLSRCPKCLDGFLDLHDCPRPEICPIFKCRRCGFGINVETGRTALLGLPKKKVPALEKAFR